MAQYAVCFCFLLGAFDLLGQLRVLQGKMLLIAPFAQQDEVFLQAIDRITQRPFFKLFALHDRHPDHPRSNALRHGR